MTIILIWRQRCQDDYAHATIFWMMEPILRIGVCRRYLLRAERHKMINPLVHQESHLIKIVSTMMMTMMTTDINISQRFSAPGLDSLATPSHTTRRGSPDSWKKIEYKGELLTGVFTRLTFCCCVCDEKMMMARKERHCTHVKLMGAS